ncbi:MAG TPA: divergent polysaccharide deacetylase family protein [Stellaceae bacterium]|nr:divergent polysaccharide deacetylase family protein [Stellaceae bacterium]
MTNPSDHNEHSHNNESGAPRHRFWMKLAVVAICFVAIGALANWLTRPPAPSSDVAVTLPPTVLAPPGPPPTAPLPTAGPQAAPPSQIAPAPPATQRLPVAAAQKPASQPLPTAAPSAAPQQAALPPTTVAPSGEQPAWLRFATAAPVTRDRPRVAIVIDDLGLDRPRTERVIGLPAAVTLSFLAYSGDLRRLTAAARRNGHEMVVHVPMEPVNAKIDMGPNGLAIDQPRDEVLRRLDWDLARFDGYVGINNHMGSRFTGDAQAMGWVMDDLKSRGLMFLDSRTIASSIGAKAAAAEGVPFAERDVFLDDDQSATAIEQRLQEVEMIARKKGTAIAIGHPHDTTIDALIGWIANLPSKGIVLVPLTEIVKARMGLG